MEFRSKMELMESDLSRGNASQVKPSSVTYSDRSERVYPVLTTYEG